MDMERLPPLRDTSYIVTGGGGGIGGATAALLVGDGAHVLVTGRTAGPLDAVVARLAPVAEAAGGSIRSFVGDNLDEGAVAEAVERAAAPTGRLDGAAAVPGGSAARPVLRTTVAELDAMFRRNVTSTFVLLRHAGSALVRGGGGSFVGVSSIQAIQPSPFFAAYSAAKAGLEMLLRSAADELGEAGVRVNAVRPGLTRSGSTVQVLDDEVAVAAFMARQPLGRVGEPEDVAGAIRYFLGPESSFATGQVISVDGGCTLRGAADLTSLHRARLGEAEMARARRGELD